MKKFLFYFFFLFVGVSCNDFDDDLKLESFNHNELEINDFIWKGMNHFYLWQEDIPDLSDTRFENSLQKTNILSKNYRSFLAGFSSPRDLFNHLKFPSDRFSFIVDDYHKLEKSFQGINLTTGIDFRLVWADNTKTRIIGVVQYVVPNSPAFAKGVKRGDFIVKVNSQELNEKNYRQLLFSDTPSVHMDFSRSADLSISKSMEILKDEIQENPILLKKTASFSGKKIGYLMYNSFISNYDLELNKVFGEFKKENISDLILDLRYNSGGSVQTAIYLASMITNANPSKVFVKQKTNKKITKSFQRNYNFTNSIGKKPIENLNLTRIFIITSKQTASASELIINGLKPYINVIQIGDVTTGKNQASITIKDWNSDGKVNPNHTWAMQPIIVESQNANGFGDYSNGLTPDIKLIENSENMGELGELSDPLFAKAVEQITGIFHSPFIEKTQPQLNDFIDNSKNYTLLGNKMFLDKNSLK